ncbi:succinate dehydrogenase assembly factor 4, mitochondrial [Fukomys damarensis]|nr:succinate dehydrogenase assembly factor 4, mitochondrial [Fukomys damarensis]
MIVSRLAGLLGRAQAIAWRAASSPLRCHSVRKSSSSPGGKSEATAPPLKELKKPRLPLGRFDAPEGSHLEQEPLTKFPEDVNPVTKEKGGPRGPEPTRYGDWERKGRCIDF